MKVPSGQQVNRQTTRIVRVGPQNIFRANITTTEVKYVNTGTGFPRVSPYQTPAISTEALSKSPHKSYHRNNFHPMPLLPKLNESSVETVKMQITAVNTTTTTPTTPSTTAATKTMTTTAATKTMTTTAMSRECVTAVHDTIEDTVRLKQSMTPCNVNGNSRCSTVMCSSVTPTAKIDNVNCQNDDVTSSERLSVNHDPNDSHTGSESKSLTDGQLVNIREHYMEESKTPLFDQKEQEKRNRRKFYWYGSHKLIKPIKDIPLRFQLMLAETNAEKARCEGRPIILRQQMDLADQFMASGNVFGPDTPRLLPGFNYDQPRVCLTNGFVEKKDKSGLTANSASSTGSVVAVTSTSSDPITNTSGVITTLSPMTQPHPNMYTLHMYSSGLEDSTSPVGSTTASASTASNGSTICTTGVRTNPSSSSSSNACCVNLSNPNAPGYLARMQPSHATLPTHSFPQVPFYFSPPAVSASINTSSSAPYMTTQQTFSPAYPQATALPHAFIPGSSSLGNTTFGLGTMTASPTGRTLSYPQYTPCISYTQNAQYTVTAVPQ